MSGRPINESRQLAILMGDKTYVGAAHDKCGTTERYVKGGGCVHCARVIATEQRDARKYLVAHAVEEAHAENDARDGLGESVQEADRRVIDDDTFDAMVARRDALRASIEPVNASDTNDGDGPPRGLPAGVLDEMFAEDTYRASIDALM